MRKKFSKGVVVFENFEEKLQLDKTDDVEDKKMYINLLIHSTTDSEVIKVLNNELKRLENEKQYFKNNVIVRISSILIL